MQGRRKVLGPSSVECQEREQPERRVNGSAVFSVYRLRSGKGKRDVRRREGRWEGEEGYCVTGGKHLGGSDGERRRGRFCGRSWDRVRRGRVTLHWPCRGECPRACVMGRKGCRGTEWDRREDGCVGGAPAEQSDAQTSSRRVARVLAWARESAQGRVGVAAAGGVRTGRGGGTLAVAVGGGRRDGDVLGRLRRTRARDGRLG